MEPAIQIDVTKQKVNDITVEENKTETKVEDKGNAPSATRKDLQLGRRLFHGSSGLLIGTCYWLLFTHQRAIYLLGLITCLMYVMEQIRISYPESAKKLKIVNKYFLRGEEYLKESSAMPYAMALLLTIITFPQPIALVAIFTLATGDPLSAIFGIRFGKHHIVKHKSVEGSIAFFISAFICTFGVFFLTYGETYMGKILGVSFLLALFSTLFEMIPLKLDDNLTIPLFVAVFLWILCGFAGFPL